MALILIFVVEALAMHEYIYPCMDEATLTLTTFTCSAISNHENIIHEMSK